MIEFEDIPLLRDPIMIAAFEGWNDAGETASSTLAHLISMWDAQPLCAMDPELYYDFQVNRPQVSGTGADRMLTWPTTKVFLARDTPWNAMCFWSRALNRRCAGWGTPAS